MLPNKKEKPTRSNYSSDETQLALYMRTIARNPVPTKLEAIELARQVQAAISLERIRDELMKGCDRAPTLEEWLNAANLSQLELQAILKKGQRARHRLLEGNLRLVLSIAKKYTKYGMELLDLMQEGSLGLMHGINKFDPTKGYAFSTYVYWWIRQGIMRSITDKSRTIRLPAHQVERIFKLTSAIARFSTKNRRPPTIDELVDLTGFSCADIEAINSISRQPLSLDKSINDDDSDTLNYFLGELDTSVEDGDRVACLRGGLEVLMERSGLTDKEKIVVSSNYGLNGDSLEIKEIAHSLGLKKSRVGSIRSAAMRKLRGQKVRHPEIVALLVE